MRVSWTRYGMFVGLAASAVLLTGCGGSSGKTNAAPSSSSPTAAASDTAAPTDSGAPSSAPSGPASPGNKSPLYSGPTLGPGHKCGNVTIVAGTIQCSHVEKVFQLYTQNKKADGKAAFAGWSCAKETTGVVCDRTGIKLRKA